MSRRRSKEISQETCELQVIEEQPSLSIVKLLGLTCGIGGLQVVWATIFSNGTPFLLSLGLPRSLTPLIWSAAPICGCLVQPFVGLLSDSSHHSWGRRRPFIVLGAIGVVLSLLGLGWASTLSSLVAGIIPLPGLAPLLAALSFWTLSLAIQPLQCGLRTLILDTCPAWQQSRANAWAARFTAVGNILGCFIGSMDVPSGRSSGEGSRFRMLCLVSILTVSCTATITCTTIKEKPRRQPSSIRPMHVFAMSSKLHSTFQSLSARTKIVFMVQFLSWTSWFGFLFYSASYVGELYSGKLQGLRILSASALLDNSGRAGALASLTVAIVAFASTSILPALVKSYDRHGRQDLSPSRKPKIETVWALALAAAALLMLSTIFVTDPRSALVLIAAMGVPWAVASWAPYVLIAGAVLDTGNDEEDRIIQDESTSEQVHGTIMGLQNIAISAPQILGAGLSALVIRVAQDWDSQDSFGWVLRVGAFSFAAASVLACRLR